MGSRLVPAYKCVPSAAGRAVLSDRDGGIPCLAGCTRVWGSAFSASLPSRWWVAEAHDSADNRYRQAVASFTIEVANLVVGWDGVEDLCVRVVAPGSSNESSGGVSSHYLYGLFSTCVDRDVVCEDHLCVAVGGPTSAPFGLFHSWKQHGWLEQAVVSPGSFGFVPAAVVRTDHSLWADHLPWMRELFGDLFNGEEIFLFLRGSGGDSFRGAYIAPGVEEEEPGRDPLMGRVGQWLKAVVGGRYE